MGKLGSSKHGIPAHIAYRHPSRHVTSSNFTIKRVSPTIPALPKEDDGIILILLAALLKQISIQMPLSADKTHLIDK